MIARVTGNLLDAKSGVIVHQVNTEGVMGAGVALAIRQKWPQVFDDYSRAIVDKRRSYGFGREYREKLMGTFVLTEIHDGLAVCSLFGQTQMSDGSRRVTSYDALDTGLSALADQLDPGTVINVPLIGCGLGGADWEVVSAILNVHFPARCVLWELK